MTIERITLPTAAFPARVTITTVHGGKIRLGRVTVLVEGDGGDGNTVHAMAGDTDVRAALINDVQYNGQQTFTARVLYDGGDEWWVIAQSKPCGCGGG